MREGEPYPGLGACELCGEVDPCNACAAPVSMRTHKSVPAEVINFADRLNEIMATKSVKKINSIFASITKK